MLRALRSLISAGILLGLAQWQGVKIEGGRMVRRKLGGALLLFLAVQLVFLALVFLAAAFFLGLADVSELVKPALITAGIIFAVAVVLVLEGFRWLKK